MTSLKKLFLTIAAFGLVAFQSVAAFAQSVPGQMTFQTPVTPVAERIFAFHDMLLWIIIPTAVFVLILLIIVVVRFNEKANPVPSRTTHNTMLEVIWTLVPVLILVVVVVPSMKLLYFSDRTHEAEMTLKVTGYQWYWGYEYPDNGGISFSSYLVPEKDLKKGELRLLTTDTPVVLPVDTNIRILTTASDVLHAWAVPSFGVKLDSVPGRTNETWTRIEKTGTYYGQCSELCGQGHGFMPIMVKAVSKEDFAQWVKDNAPKQ